ncbi:hypothetical protein C3F09_06680 [candidate division GN15 bacterium]|uniref:DUF3857 domain-containing protein n=1 Tax=candidate division GN15 bacterium TaxID=2072418 RepID=A0A855X7A0_9BACT|nr:MAG: hypothetical protein C3F09_06680 [candidate division GN15 bacterium]
MVYRYRIFLLTIVIIAIAPLCASAGMKGFGKVSPEEWGLGAPAEYPEANAVVIHDLCSLTVRLSGIETVRWERIKLLSKAGAEEVGDAGFEYYEGDKIKDLEAQTITPDGKVYKLSNKDYFTKSVGHYKVRTFAFPNLDSGCIVEFQYRTLRDIHEFDPWYFQSEIYTLKSTLTLVVGPGFVYSSSWTNVPPTGRTAKPGEIANMDNPRLPLKTYTWEMKNLMPVTDEPYMAARSDYYSGIFCQLMSYEDQYQKVIFVRNWQDLGKEFQEYVDRYARGGGTGDLAAQITAGISDAMEKARAIYAWVTKEIKTEQGHGLYFNNENLSELRKTGVGLGQEKNVLLVKLLNEAGIQAWPVLIGTRDFRKFNPDIFQLSQFNYIISFVQFDSSVLYLDASSQYCPYGMLTPDCLVDAGFLVDGKNSQLVRILRPEVRTYRLDVTHMQIDSNGAVSCSTLSNLSGYFAPEYGSSAEESAENDFVKEYYLNKLGVPFTLDTADVILDSAGKCLVMARYTLPDYTRLLDSVVTIRPVSFRYRSTPFTKQRRSVPVDFNYPFTYHNIVTIASDRPLTSAVMPPDTTFQIDGATYRRVSQFADGTVTIDSRLIVTVPTFSPLVYPGVRRLFEFIAQSQGEAAALVRQ